MRNMKILGKKVIDFEKQQVDADILNKNLGGEMDKRIEVFETQLRTMRECIAEKDAQIASLEERLSKIESEDNTKHLKMVELKEKCFQCDFETTSKHGLKVHIAKKHTVRSTFSCEFCERIFENEKDMRKHLKTHSYKKANFKCLECDFVGETEKTMDVHSGKEHSNNFECGICDLKLRNKEDLEVHLFTCEIYVCRKREFKAKTISEVKLHTESMHGTDKDHFLHHIKMDRNNVNEVSDSKHYFDEI